MVRIFFAVSGTRFAHPPVDASFAFYFVSFSNAASLVGRVAAGLLSDRYGCLNTVAPLLLLAAGTTFAWPFCLTKQSLIGISVAYGFTSGGYTGLFAAPVAYVGHPEDLGLRMVGCPSFTASFIFNKRKHSNHKESSLTDIFCPRE